MMAQFTAISGRKNDGDEEDETEVLQVQRLENERLQQVVNRQGNDEHESNGYTQTG